jgi:hypothetical protein
LLPPPGPLPPPPVIIFVFVAFDPNVRTVSEFLKAPIPTTKLEKLLPLISNKCFLAFMFLIKLLKYTHVFTVYSPPSKGLGYVLGRVGTIAAEVGPSIRVVVEEDEPVYKYLYKKYIITRPAIIKIPVNIGPPAEAPSEGEFGLGAPTF